MIVQVNVEIPDGWELACDEMRAPLDGEHYMNLRNGVNKAFCVTSDYGPRIIVRKAWEWPPWLRAAAIVIDQRSRQWKACHKVPHLDEGLNEGWDGFGHWATITKDMFDFTPPPCFDWRESCRLNPNHVENQ